MPKTAARRKSPVSIESCHGHGARRGVTRKAASKRPSAPLTPAKQVLHLAFEKGWLCDTLERGSYVLTSFTHGVLRVPVDLKEDQLAEFQKRLMKPGPALPSRGRHAA